nr:MAG TPA: hypothetical protein [Caudoviricetes sp.]
MLQFSFSWFPHFLTYINTTLLYINAEAVISF